MDKKQKEQRQNLRKRSNATQDEVNELKAIIDDTSQKKIHAIAKAEIIRNEFNLQQIRYKIWVWDR